MIGVKWYKAATYRRVEVGKDATRNPVTRLEPTGESVLVRAAPWAPKDGGSDGNRYDEARRTFVTPAAPELLEGVAAVGVGGSVYEVVRFTRGGSMAALTVGRCMRDGA